MSSVYYLNLMYGGLRISEITYATLPHRAGAVRNFGEFPFHALR
jgi:hypothetical protein